MNRPLTRKRRPALITATCLAVSATGVLQLMKLPPPADTSAKTEAPAPTLLPAAGATETSAANALTPGDSTVAPPRVSVPGEVITAHLATVPESVWHESTPAQPPYAVPAPSYPPFPNDPPAPGVPIINSPLQPADAAPPGNSEK